MKSQVKLAILTTGIVIVALLLIFTGQRAPGEGLRAAFDAEFLVRPDGYEGLSEEYGFHFPTPPLQMDPGLMYRAVADGAVDVINAFATDGRIPAYNLLVLEDNLGFFPPYYAAPLVRTDTLARYPQIADILNMLAGRLDDQTMQELNFQVDEKGRLASEVAREFLRDSSLVPAEETAPQEAEGQVVIGGKHFTEQEILGHIMAQLLEAHSGLQVVRRLNLGGTMICFNALRAGDLDIYPEYTGTGLVNILGREVIADPEAAYQAVKEDFRERFSLAWLNPLGFNNTYTLTMRREDAEELGIQTISDLARYLREAGK